MYALRQILIAYPVDCCPESPRNIRALGGGGGLSGAELWRIGALRSELVLRRWPAGHPTPARLRFIHAVIGQACERGLSFIPPPLATRNGATFLETGGRLWELAPWMPGQADYHDSASEARLRGALVTLARFHAAVADFRAGVLPVESAAAGKGSECFASRIDRSPNLRQRLTLLDEWTPSRVGQFAAAIDKGHKNFWPELSPLAHKFLALLPYAAPLAINRLSPLAEIPFALQPCLRDVWHDHVLFTGDEVTGLVDFGAMDIESPATDVARLLGSLVGDDREGWRTGLAAYQSIRPLTDDELRAVEAFDTSGVILAGCNWLRWLYIEGRQFDNREQVIERFARIVERVERIVVP